MDNLMKIDRKIVQDSGHPWERISNLYLNPEQIDYVVVDMNQDNVKIHVSGIQTPVSHVFSMEGFYDSPSKWFIRCSYKNSLCFTDVVYYINPNKIVKIFQYPGTPSSFVSFLSREEDIIVNESVSEIRVLIQQFIDNNKLRNKE